MSVLDFPRKTLPKDLWDYKDDESLPRLKKDLRGTLIAGAKKLLKPFDLELIDMNFYGGSASYQWSPGADIDISLYVEWPESDNKKQTENIQEQFKDAAIPYKGHEIHFFLKNPEDKFEVADAVYDILNEEWILPPLILPKGFDPDDYFKPFIMEAEAKAKRLDEKLGMLSRSLSALHKASDSKSQAKEPEVVQRRINEEKDNVRQYMKYLAKEFWKTREARYAMHDALRGKVGRGELGIGRYERFQAPEIVWKYLDRAGYNDCLWHIYAMVKDNELEPFLAGF